jgi:membrane protein CcdC involved in cytochrome C biogenesis
MTWAMARRLKASKRPLCARCIEVVPVAVIRGLLLGKGVSKPHYHIIRQNAVQRILVGMVYICGSF